MEPETPSGMTNNSYHSELNRIRRFLPIVKILSQQYEICMGCIYRIFSVLSVKMYTDASLSNQITASILLSWGTIKLCWLCSGILQSPYIEDLAVKIIKNIGEDNFGHKNWYKLNVRIHNMLNVKFQIFYQLLLEELKIKVNDELLQQFHKEIIKPLTEKNPLEMKTVFKWVLSNYLNLSHCEFNMKSTITENQDTVIVTINIDYSGKQLHNYASASLASSLHINAVSSKSNHNKKIKIDVEPLKNFPNYDLNWTTAMTSRINLIARNEWEEISQKTDIKELRQHERKGIDNIKETISLSSENIYLCGRYIKFSRYLSQTPWIITNQKMTENSLQEVIQKKLIQFFYPPSLPNDRVDVKFHAGGREDVDVRMLKGGRPFVLEFVNPRFNLKDIIIETILNVIKDQYPDSFGKLPKSGTEGLKDEEQQQVKVFLLMFLVNESTEVCRVQNFLKTTANYISNELKKAEGQKIKHYICYIKSQQPFTSEDKAKLESYDNLPILQKTPIRVLHRRTLMYRNKMIHKLLFHKVSKFSAILQVWGSAGTYIKQFVHGDMNRTMPNVGSLLGNRGVDILQLDVGSLKQGEWEQNDHEKMKLGLFTWQKDQ